MLSRPQRLRSRHVNDAGSRRSSATPMVRLERSSVWITDPGVRTPSSQGGSSSIQDEQAVGPLAAAVVKRHGRSKNG